jgi:hypothetical protein
LKTFVFVEKEFNVRSTLVGVLAGLLLTAGTASATTIDFETRSDALTPFIEGDLVDNEFLASLGVSFTNATILTLGGGTLNDADFPVYSGFNLVFDATGPIEIAFSAPIVSFSGRVTYNTTLTLQPFDTSNSPLASVSSLFTFNFGSSGNAPNELISANFAGGISRVVLTGDAGGGSFSLDDVTFAVRPTGPVDPTVPEPATLSLVLLGGATAAYRRWRR